MSDIRELNPEEMANVNGGVGGSPNPLPKRSGYVCYQIKHGDTLIHLAKRYRTTVADLYDANKDYITVKSDITKGYYIYVPEIDKN